MKILLIEDDMTISYGIKRHLQQLNYEVCTAFSVRDVFRFLDDDFDVLIVDVNLPDGSGHDVVKEYKTKHDTPVIFLTANDTDASIDAAFDIGADDYMTKPFRLSELSRRIQAILRRSQTNTIILGNLIIDLSNLAVTSHNKELSLSIQEFKILVLLARHVNHIVSRHELNLSIWDTNEHISENALSVSMKRLREKLGEDVIIETVHGKGYILKHE